MDCFYAAVEMLDNPKLRDVPLAIGGPSKTKGVLCTSNYKAREFGVSAAMPTFKAFQLCPHLTLIPPDFHKYEKVSSIIRKIFYKYTDLVETVSLDEAYLDVTNCDFFGGSATLIAREIKKEIYEQTGLTASAGVSFNKMLAKVASDWKKPNGIFVITPEQRLSFIKELPLKKIPGIGKVSSQKLERMGLIKCGDVLNRDLFELITLFGKRSALDLYESCQGISNSRVNKRRKRKSFGIERTFYEPISLKEDIREEVELLKRKYNARFKLLDNYHLDEQEISHLSIKIRFSDFSTYTKEIPVSFEESDLLITQRNLTKKSEIIYDELFKDMMENHQKDVRLIGLGLKLRKKSHRQMDLMWTSA